jgi:cation:H+ antiporter
VALTAVSPALLVPLFLVSLAVTLAAARLFARRLDRLATSRGIPEALVGVLTAVAADSPEISAALVALVTGAPSVSVGVVVGSNLFNLAAMIGVSALVAGRVVLRREALVLEGAVGLVALAAGAAVLVGVVPVAAFVVVMAVLVPYVLVLVLGPQVLTRTRLHARMIEGLRRALAEREPAARRPPAIPPPMWPEALLFGADVALIALGSIGMVQAALALGDRWGVRAEVIGVLVLAPLTSLPNAATAVRLGVGGRGSALVSETFNSNTINLVAGLAIPALFVGTPGLSRTGRLDLIWLGAMTVFCLALLWRPPGMRRGGAAAVVALYLGFVATQAMLR